MVRDRHDLYAVSCSFNFECSGHQGGSTSSSDVQTPVSSLRPRLILLLLVPELPPPLVRVYAITEILCDCFARISSMAAASDHVDHVRTQIPYALLGATGATLLNLLVG